MFPMEKEQAEVLERVGELIRVQFRKPSEFERSRREALTAWLKTWTNARVLGWEEDYSELDFARLHRDYIGGSAAASCIERDPRKSLFELICEMQGRVPVRLYDDYKGRDPKAWGKRFQNGIIEMLAEVKPEWTIIPGGVVLQDAEHPWMIASIDFFVIDEHGRIGVGDAKNVSWWMAEGWGTDEEPTVPEHMETQINHYMGVLGASCRFGVLYACVGGHSDRLRRYERDQGQINWIRGEEQTVMGIVRSDELPIWLARGGEGTKRTMDQVFPEPESDSAVTLPAEGYEMVSQWLELKRTKALLDKELAALEEKESRCKNYLTGLLGDATEGRTVFGHIVTRKWQNGVWKDKASLTVAEKAEWAHIRKAYQEQTRFPVLRVKEPKK